MPPISATRTHHESESQAQYSPTQFRIPRRPTHRTMVAARIPVSSMPIPSNSFFQKTRSLFELASQCPSPPAPTSPLSSLFTVDKSSPSPPRRNPSRPTSLILSPAGYGDLIPKSLDGYGMPHTTKSSLHSPSSRYTYKRKEVELREERRGASETGKHHPFFFWLDSRSSWVRVGLKTVCITRIGARVWRRRSRYSGMRGRRMGIDHARVIGG
jgi:hypothetical protein